MSNGPLDALASKLAFQEGRIDALVAMFDSAIDSTNVTIAAANESIRDLNKAMAQVDSLTERVASLERVVTVLQEQSIARASYEAEQLERNSN